MPVIDAHAHLWQRARTPEQWIDPQTMAVIDHDFWVDDLASMQRASGIDGTILVQSTNSAQETLDLLAISTDPAVAGVVGWIDLEADVSQQLDVLAAAPGGENLVGMRHLAHQDPDPQWLLRPTVDFASLASRGLVFDVVVHAPQLATAAAAAAAHPELTFVLDHLGNPPIASGKLGEWRSDIRRIAELHNVVVKLSGITLQTNWNDWSIDDLRYPVDVALDAFGPERILFGSDWPLLMLASDAAGWVHLVRELTLVEHHNAILGGNAERIYLGGQHA